MEDYQNINKNNRQDIVESHHKFIVLIQVLYGDLGLRFDHVHGIHWEAGGGGSCCGNIVCHPDATAWSIPGSYLPKEAGIINIIFIFSRTPTIYAIHPLLPNHVLGMQTRC